MKARILIDSGDAVIARLLGLPRPVKQFVALFFDSCLVAGTVWLSFFLRLEEFVPLTGARLWAVGIAVALAIPIFILMGLYQTIFRYSGWRALVRIAWAVAIYGALFAAVFTFYGVAGVPRSVAIIQPVLLLVLLVGSRAVVRDVLNRPTTPVESGVTSNVLIYGAGRAGHQLATALSDTGRHRVVGYLDDSPALHGRRVNGRLVYNPARLPRLISKLNVTDILLAIPSASRARRNEILKALETYSLRVRTMPAVDELASGEVRVAELKELSIDDLLGRDSVVPDPSLVECRVRDKVVIITGAGGSIGSELCRQILVCGPKKLILFDLSEFALFRIHQELAAKAGSTELIPVLGSVQDDERISDVIATYKPDTIYHAAAYKHVPLVQGNPVEGLKNNVWGTLFCALAAKRHRVPHFVLVSTDKAVRPTNIMGASKRLAELVLQALHQEASHDAEYSDAAIGPETCFSMVRFGNVLASSGSVVPLFREQIEEGGPVTLTHLEVTRFFMTIPEAAQLVLQAGAMARGGDVFVLDMGEPVQIAKLARRMISLSGLTVRDEENPVGDIDIKVVGLRPGEKLYEELLIGDNPQPTDHSRIMKANEDCIGWAALEQELKLLRVAMTNNDLTEIEAVLTRLVAGYKASGDCCA